MGTLHQMFESKIHWLNLASLCRHSGAVVFILTDLLWRRRTGPQFTSVPDHAFCPPPPPIPEFPCLWAVNPICLGRGFLCKHHFETLSKLPYSGFQSWLSPEKLENQHNRAGPPGKKEKGKCPHNSPHPSHYSPPLLLRCLKLSFPPCQTANFLLSEDFVSQCHWPLFHPWKGILIFTARCCIYVPLKPDCELVFFKIKVFNFLGIHRLPFCPATALQSLR